MFYYQEPVKKLSSLNCVCVPACSIFFAGEVSFLLVPLDQLDVQSCCQPCEVVLQLAPDSMRVSWSSRNQSRNFPTHHIPLLSALCVSHLVHQVIRASLVQQSCLKCMKVWHEYGGIVVLCKYCKFIIRTFCP